jgi:hypothetical protein
LHDIIDNVNNESNYTIFHFKENFKYAVENLTHSLISIIFAYRNDLSESLRFEPYDKLLEKFKRLEKTYHMARKKIPNCLIDKDISYYATGEKTKHGEGLETVKVLNKFTSIEELFNKVKENFKG